LKKLVKNIFIILTHEEKRKFIKLIIYDIIISILDISFLLLLLYVINFYAQPHHSKAYLFFPLNLFDKYPLLLITLFFFLFCIKNFFGFLVFRMQYKYSYDVASRISRDNLVNYLEGSFNDYVNIDFSVRIRRIAHQPIEFSHSVLRSIQQIISQSVLIILTIIPIIIYKPLLFPLLFLILVPPVFITAFLMKKKLGALRVSGKIANEKAIQHLNEALSGYIESNIYDRKNFFTDRYYHFQVKLNRYISEQLIIQNLPSRLIEVFAVLGLFMLIVINLFVAKSNSVQIIIIGAFMAAAYKIIPGIVKILNSAGQAKTYAYTVTDLLNEKNNYRASSFQNNETSNLINSVIFSHVCMSYKNHFVLNNFSMNIQEGDFVGISGNSGKGKTTLINLLMGFLSANDGNIFINHVLTTPGERSKFWKNIAYVKQQPFFIHDTVLKNITLNENNVDEKKVQHVVEVTGLAELLNKYPEGIEKLITENGKNISGGQRQRISIARALYKDADLIILDEPFSELDTASENCLLNHFKELASSGKMIILITHNKESLSFCDKIISLDAK
jgi:ABC-type multidrug transport system fused ATPase/permease subunit